MSRNNGVGIGLTSDQGMNNYYIGRAGEYAVAAQLMIRKCLVHWPAIDEGYDLITKTGCRIQVKSSQLSAIQTPGSYWFGFPAVKHRNLNRKSGEVKVVKRPNFSSVCDVVICWGINDNRFWVIPSKICDSAQALVLGIENTRRFSGKIKPLRDMANLGYTHKAIGKQYGIDRVVVTRLINSDAEEQKETVFAKARACENAWEHILNHGEPDPEYKPGEVQEEVHGMQLG